MVFPATAYDQFAVALNSQPAFTWQVVSGGGTITSTGLYPAPGGKGTATVPASAGGVSGRATVTIRR